MPSPKIELPPLKRWMYLPEWCAWWLVLEDNSVIARLGYGPFNETEAQWAAEIHGVPFAAAIRSGP